MSVVVVLVSSLALAWVQQGPKIQNLPPDRFPEFLRGLGYEVTALNRQDTLLEVSDGDLKFQVAVAVGKSPGNPGGYVSFAELSGGYVVDRYIPKEVTENWSFGSAQGRGNVASYLDGTVFATWRADIEGMTEDGIRKDLSEFEVKLKLIRGQYLRGLNPKQASVSKTYDVVKPDMTATLYGIETRDLAYLIRQWHCIYPCRGAFMFEGGCPPQFVKMGGGAFYVSVPDRWMPSIHDTFLGVTGAPESAKDLKGITWATVTRWNDDWYSVKQPLDFSNGMSLGQLHRRLEDFGGRIARLRLELDFTKHPWK